MEKQIAKLGGTVEDMKVLKAKTSKKKKRSRNDDSEDDDANADGLLVVKKVHEWGSKEQPLPDIHLNEATKSRHAKKIRIDGSSAGANKKTVFNDDGDEIICHMSKFGWTIRSLDTFPPYAAVFG